ncbi:transmembrane signal receptor [Lithospermum erythrorhizon]|uniref:non-specific serine/threonine protein kinase n=1 Tax=Lithospermum erythrorhizon TaxID=34254 RepID=A0AAV3QX49_LITER
MPSIFHHLFLLLLPILSSIIIVQSLNQEGNVLLDFKNSLSDKQNNLKSWNFSSLNPCKWYGIQCNENFNVISIHLNSLSLSGTLSSTICKLPYLTELNMSTNFISGEIPVFANCQNLEVLDLCTNRLHTKFPSHVCNITTLRELYLCENYIYGEIPLEIGNLEALEELVIYSNNLTGAIPPSIRELKRVRIIRAGRNYLSGPIPDEISECESLEVLGLAENNLEGTFPVKLQKLKRLSNLILWKNNFYGNIPGEIGNFSSLELLALHKNSFTGFVPKEIGKLTKLRRLYIYTNLLNGTIPQELGNCVNAVEIDLSENQLSGFIPKELGKISGLRLLHLFENLLQGHIPLELAELKQLRKLDLSINDLSGSIPLGLQNLTFLEDLQLFDNNLEGFIPPFFGINSINLSILDMSMNNLVGRIPEGICRSEKLIILSLGSNKLTGNIPFGLKTCRSLEQLMLGNNLLTGSLSIELAKLQNLSALELHQNRFSGLIPLEIGNFTKIERLRLSNNNFFGAIPPEIGKLVKLVTFNISSNRLSGKIPHEIGNCAKLQRLDLSNNLFTGSVPNELGMLVNLELLKLSDNLFNGMIPDSLGNLVRLTELQMGGNFFSGSIPYDLGKLSALQIALNISHNDLTGEIPGNLGNLQMLESMYLNDNQLVGEIPTSLGELKSLTVCNFSNNRLEGVVPNTPAFMRMDSSNFAGNSGLCLPGAPNCHHLSSVDALKKDGWSGEAFSRQKIIIIASMIVGLISLVLVFRVCWLIKHQTTAFASFKDQVQPDDVVIDNNNSNNNIYYSPKGLTYQALVEATDNFADHSIIGSGACGVVYKAIMEDGQVIAVKKLHNREDHETSSSDQNSFNAEISTLGNIRHKNIVKLIGFCKNHQGCSLLLYEYMPNGSLGEILHGNSAKKCTLDWHMRYEIALGAAEGLCYLHHGCKPLIIHRDIKSNNILLDESLQAHVGDFGLAKLMEFANSKSMSAVAGSYGYIAPEYAYTLKVTEKCDVYSFGVVLLELITGRSPVQPIDQGGDLVSWARKTIHTEDVATSEIFDKRLDLSVKRTVDEMSLVLKIALFCTSTSPLNRPSMREVIAMLIDSREASTSPHSPTSETPLDADDTYF